MPGGFAVGDIIEVTFKGDVYNQTVLNILHYRVLTAATGSTTVQSDSLATAEHVGPAGGADIWTLMALLLANDYNLEGVRVQDVFPVRYAPVFAALPAQGTGGPGNSTNLAGVITKQTRLSGRDQVGSIHLGPIADGDQDQGFMAGTWLTDAQSLADAMEVVLSPVAGLTLEPVIWHRTVPATGTYSTRITNCTPRDTLRVMRRRTVRVGK